MNIPNADDGGEDGTASTGGAGGDEARENDGKGGKAPATDADPMELVCQICHQDPCECDN